MKSSALLTLAASLLVCSSAWAVESTAPAAGAAVQTQRQYLSGLGKDDAIPWEFMSSGGRKSGQWTKIPVPSCWELQGFGTYRYGHEERKDKPAPIVGKYRRTFAVPAEWSSRRVFIVFDGVMTDAEVKVNGTLAGPIHQGAFYRFKHDITSLLKSGQENLLEVAVADRSAEESVNRAERQGDYWNFGGIFRPVWLEALPMQFVEHIAIDARHDGAFAMEFVLGGAGKADVVEVTILDAKDQPLGPPITADITAKRVAGKFDRCATWTAETPAMHTAVVRLKQGGTVLHEVRQKFGFRTIEVRPRDGIYVNGVKVVLKGACRHSFWPDSGRTLSEEIHRKDIALMKEMNMNAVRMSHYPPDERFLELCDELGMYVLDELSGWQKCYDAEPGRKLLVEMIARDVNHPCILFWDNGNEGGWNTQLDDDYAKHDPQKRNVLHPWEFHGNVNTKHYPTYDDFEKLLKQGEITMPTEFLHGLFDGGMGAGLEEYWALVNKYPNAAGGFLWALVDEGVKYDDTKAIDVKGNWAPDGMLGPYREKEGSFLSIKQLWSPIVIQEKQLPEQFGGTFMVENHYSFTDAKQCRFSWQLRKFRRPEEKAVGFSVIAEGPIASPAIAPGGKGTLTVELPKDWREADALAIRVDDPAGAELWTWVYPVKRATAWPNLVAGRADVTASETADEIQVKAGELLLTFSKQTGFLVSVKRGGTTFALANGPRLVVGGTNDLDSGKAKTGEKGKDKAKASEKAPEPVKVAPKPLEESKLVSIKHSKVGENVEVRATYSGNLESVVWQIRSDGWVAMGYVFNLTGEHCYFGMGFDYPKDKMKSMKWLGNGPYRAWQNRIPGGTWGVWSNEYNDTLTGHSVWKYPEFKGYYANVGWMQWSGEGQTITAICTGPQYVQVLKDEYEKGLPAKAYVPYPAADVSFLHAIPAIGNKFHAAAQTGPLGKPAVAGEDHGGIVSFFFGEIPGPPKRCGNLSE